MNLESERPRTSSRHWVRTASVQDPREDQAGQVAEGELAASRSSHVERVRAVDALVLKPVAGVGARQRAQRHHPRHEAPVGVRFAGRDKLVHLIGLSEVVHRLGRGVADRLQRAIQIGQGFTDGNQLAALTLHGLYSPIRLRQDRAYQPCWGMSRSGVKNYSKRARWSRNRASASTPASRHPISTRSGCSCGSYESSWNAGAGRRSSLSKRSSPGSRRRPERDRLLDAARRREIDIIPSGTYRFRDQRARLE